MTASPAARLLAQTWPDGSIGEGGAAGTVPHYRVGWALALAGRLPAAHGHLAWVAEHDLHAYGAVGGRAPPAGESRGFLTPWTSSYLLPYGYNGVIWRPPTVFTIGLAPLTADPADPRSGL